MSPSFYKVKEIQHDMTSKEECDGEKIIIKLQDLKHDTYKAIMQGHVMIIINYIINVISSLYR